MHDVQNFSNRMKLERTVTLKKSNSMSAQSKDLFQTTAQFTGPYHQSVQPNRTIRRDLHDKIFWMVDGNRSARWLRRTRRESHQLVMTKSTSRMSISGTTFMSDTIPRFPAQKEPMSHLASRNTPGEEDPHNPRKQENDLLASFQLGGDQADPVDARLLH